MQTIKYPTNTKALVLYYLITRNKITEKDVQLNGYRARLSDLRDLGLDIKFRDVEFKNRFGRVSKVRESYLDEKGKKKAISLYDKINIDNRPKKG